MTVCLTCLLLLSAILCACTTTPIPSTDAPPLPATDPSSPTTAATDTPPSTEQKIIALLADFSPTESLTVIATQTGGHDELKQTETMTVTDSDGGRLFRRERVSQKLLPIVIDENHNVISAGGLSTENSVEYLYEGQEGACFPAVGMVLRPEEYASLSLKENDNGTHTLTCNLSSGNLPAWLADLVSGSLMSGTLSVVADLSAGQISAISVFLYTWTDHGAARVRVTVTYNYDPKSFSLPG